MNPPKCDDQDYLNFLVATPRAFRALEAARVQPAGIDPPAHDAFTRLRHGLEPDPQTLWHEAPGEVKLDAGRLVFDDSTLDHLSARQIELVCREMVGQASPGRARHQFDDAAVDGWGSSPPRR